MRASDRATRILPALVALVSLTVPAAATTPAAAGDPPTRVLFLSKSSGFEHSAIRRVDGRPSHVELVLAELGAENGFTIESTKDAGRIRREVLDDFDVVVFYTTGDLTERGGDASKGIFAGDGEDPMGASGVSDLMAWIRAGGGFVGFHCASDTFRSEGTRPTDYIAMLGGEFESHGAQFEGLVRVVDPDHPVTRDAPRELVRLDEWYLFQHFDESAVHVLRVLDPRDEGTRQPAYDREPYPIVWTRELGEGRIYYDAQGHREDVWDDDEFRQSVVRALRWADGDADAPPAGG